MGMPIYRLDVQAPIHPPDLEHMVGRANSILVPKASERPL